MRRPDRPVPVTGRPGRGAGTWHVVDGSTARVWEPPPGLRADGAEAAALAVARDAGYEAEVTDMDGALAFVIAAADVPLELQNAVDAALLGANPATGVPEPD